MSQISPPIRILLVLTVAVLGVYMLFLRPKPEETPPLQPTDTSVSQPGKVRDAAEDAVDAANGQLSEQESVDGVDAGEAAAGTATKPESAAKPGATAAAIPAQDLKGLPKPVRNAIRQDKVLVLLFWNEKSADDRAVRESLSGVSRRDGDVFVHAAPLARISRYGRIARGVDVEQSPTVVIADRDLRAETLVGYVDRTTINQAVSDALRSTDELFTGSYLRTIDKVCVQYGNRFHSIPFYYAQGNVPRLDRRLDTIHATLVQFAADFKAVKAPKRLAAFRSAAVADLSAFNGHVARYSGAITRKTGLRDALAAQTSFRVAAQPVNKRINHRFDAQGLLRCGSQL